MVLFYLIQIKNQPLNKVEDTDSGLAQDLNDDQLGAMFAVASEVSSDQTEKDQQESMISSDEERLNLDFVAGTHVDQDFNEDLEVDVEEPEETASFRRIRG